MTTATVKPACLPDGKPLVIRDPDSGLIIPAEGIAVTLSPYWRQRLAHGDVVEVKAAEPAPELGTDTADQAPRKTKAKE